MPSVLLTPWLDTKTRSDLGVSPPVRETAVDIKSYSLLLLKAGPDESWAINVVAEIQRCGARNSTRLPNVIAQQMKFDDAWSGQLALSCCDCISAFLPDEIVADEDVAYLQHLSDKVMSSPEFERVPVRVMSIPATDLGRRYSRQFLGVAAGLHLPLDTQIHRKKARLMQHWADQCGVRLDGSAS